MYQINAMMSFAEVVITYENYVDDMKKANKKPASFLHFITGRY